MPEWRPHFGERFASRFPRYGQRAERAMSGDAGAPVRPSLDAGQPWNPSNQVPKPNGRTAIYDIAAHTVYLPDGTSLEAHSGLGSKLDDPRYVGLKNRGPTPPNIYGLALRDQPFHGVRAIRLIPFDEHRMFGRDGMLAHSYMRGPTGQSNGCVSFRDYAAFLRAFMTGWVDRLVVVDHLSDDSS